MQNTSVRPADGMEESMKRYGNMLFRLCLITLGNEADAEDVVQETFIKWMQKAPVFADAEHEKAWLIRVAANQCRDILRFRTRHPVADIGDLQEYAQEMPDSGIMEALMTVPERFRMVLHLYYVEEYSIAEIAKIIGRTSSAVKMRLQKGRSLLKEAYGKECQKG